MSTKKTATRRTLDDLPDQELRIILPISRNDLQIADAVAQLKRSTTSRLIASLLMENKALQAVMMELRDAQVQWAVDAEATAARQALIDTLPPPAPSRESISNASHAPLAKMNNAPAVPHAAEIHPAPGPQPDLKQSPIVRPGQLPADSKNG